MEWACRCTFPRSISTSAIAASIAANIARLTALGVQVHITELDVSLPLDSSGMPRPDDLIRQAEVYRGVVRACLHNPGCTAIQTWGFTDKYSWIGSHSHGTRGRRCSLTAPTSPSPPTRGVGGALGGTEVGLTAR